MVCSMEQHRYKALMQLLLACTGLVFLPTCPLQLEMRVKVMEQLSSRLEGLLSADGESSSGEKVDPLSNSKSYMYMNFREVVVIAFFSPLSLQQLVMRLLPFLHT